MLPKNYELKTGFSGDKALLIKFLYLTYKELFPQQTDFTHLTKTVENYFSSSTPLWWITKKENQEKIACLWLGKAIDQASGQRYSHIFLLYVKPEYRRQGIATFLLQYAEQYAQTQGHLQIGLQVYPHNQTALNLYNNLGYNTNSFLMLKSFNNN